MTAIRQSGKINEDTTLIDIEMLGVPGIFSMYLIESGKKCIIDAGTETEAQETLNKLKELNAFPPDMIILTHTHWDHTQAIPFLCQEAEKMGKKIEILASAPAIPHLRDQSFNDAFGMGPYNNIENDITPLKEGDIVDLEGITLKIFEIPGHINDHIAILDEKHNNIYVGDAIGDKVLDNFFLPPFMPPYWEKEAYFNSINKLKNIDYDALSLAHFGYIYDDEAKSILDESVSVYERWWKLLEENVDKLFDLAYMKDTIIQKVIPNFEHFGEVLAQAVLFWLATGFKIYKKL